MAKNLNELFNEFYFECEFVKQLRPATLKGYRSVFDTFTKLSSNISLETLNSSDIIEFFRQINTRQRIVGRNIIKTGVKKSTLASYWTKLNNFFKWIERKGLIAQNPFVQIAYPTPSYEDRKYLTRDNVERILTTVLRTSDNAFLLKRNLLLFSFLIYCGLRKEELLQLQIRDININKRELSVRRETSKSSRTRYIPLHSQLVIQLKDYYKERKKYTSQYLFTSSKRDEQLTSDGLNHLVNKIRASSRINFHIHQFRHTFAVNFLKASNNVVKLKQLLGHKDISITLIYLRCLPTKELRADVEGMKIDDFL